MFRRFGRTAIASAMMLLSSVAFAQEGSLTDWGLMRAQLADMEAAVNDRDRKSGWKYSMEAEYALLAISRALQALEEVERKPAKANLDEFLQRNQRSHAAYNRFIDLTENESGKPRIWRN